MERTEPIAAYAPLWGEWEPREALMALAGFQMYRASAKSGGLACVSLREMRGEGADIAARRVASLMRTMANLSACANIVATHRVECVPHEAGTDILARTERVSPLVPYLNAHPPTEAEILRVGIDVCQALIDLEKRRVTHLAIAPENLYVASGGIYKLDAPARLHERDRLGRPCGALRYAAPEVWQGENCDARSDVYALGMTLLRLLGDDPEDKPRAFQARMDGAPVRKPAQIGELAWEALSRACAFRPEDRQSGAQALLDDLLAAYIGKKRRPAGERRAYVARPSVPPRPPVPAPPKRVAPPAPRIVPDEAPAAEPEPGRRGVGCLIRLIILALLVGAAVWAFYQPFAEPLREAWAWLSPRVAEFFRFEWFRELMGFVKPA